MKVMQVIEAASELKIRTNSRVLRFANVKMHFDLQSDWTCPINRVVPRLCRPYIDFGGFFVQIIHRRHLDEKDGLK